MGVQELTNRDNGLFGSRYARRWRLESGESASALAQNLVEGDTPAGITSCGFISTGSSPSQGFSEIVLGISTDLDDQQFPTGENKGVYLSQLARDSYYFIVSVVGDPSKRIWWPCSRLGAGDNAPDTTQIYYFIGLFRASLNMAEYLFRTDLTIDLRIEISAFPPDIPEVRTTGPMVLDWGNFDGTETYWGRSASQPVSSYFIPPYLLQNGAYGELGVSLNAMRIRRDPADRIKLYFLGGSQPTQEFVDSGYIRIAYGSVVQVISYQSFSSGAFYSTGNPWFVTLIGAEALDDWWEDYTGEGSPLPDITLEMTLDRPSEVVLAPEPVRDVWVEVLPRSYKALWLPPEDNGSPITSYELRNTVDNRGGLGPINVGLVQEIEFVDVTPGEIYQVQVRAVSTVGAGAYGSLVNAIPGGKLPNVPRSISVGRIDNLLEIRFIAPIGDDQARSGEKIIDYECRIDSGPWLLCGGPDFEGKGYIRTTLQIPDSGADEVRIRARNPIGPGPQSHNLLTSTVTVATVPNPPTNLTWQLVNDFASVVSFTAPDNVTFAMILRYEYRIDGGMRLSTGSTLPQVDLTGISSSEPRSVEIRGVNSIGPGAWSEPLTFRIPGPPKRIYGFEVRPGDTEAYLSWEPPDDGGSPITDYEYELNAGWTSIGSTETATTITELVNGTVYYFRVRAVNDRGNGVPSFELSSTPISSSIEQAVAPPSKIAVWSITAKDEAAEITLTPPSGEPIASYEAKVGSGSWTPVPHSLSGSEVVLRLLGLSAGIEVSVTVRGRNAVGVGPDSDAEVVTPTAGETLTPSLIITPTNRDTPAQITDLTMVIVSSSSVRFSFSAPDDGGSAITRYEYKAGSGATWPSMGMNTTETLTGQSGLVAVIVRAVNANGNGLESSVAGVRLPNGTPFSL